MVPFLTLAVCALDLLRTKDPEGHEEGGGSLTVGQQKASRIMESFQNPFRMV